MLLMSRLSVSDATMPNSGRSRAESPRPARSRPLRWLPPRPATSGETMAADLLFRSFGPGWLARVYQCIRGKIGKMGKIDNFRCCLRGLSFVSFFLTDLTGIGVDASLDAHELPIGLHLEQQLVERVTVAASCRRHDFQDGQTLGARLGHCRHDRTSLARTVNLTSITQQRPSAGRLVELT